MKRLLFATLFLVSASVANAAVTSNTLHATGGNDLNSEIAVGDAVSGLVATELAPFNGWHPAPTPPEPERLEAFTDDAGPISNLTGLLNDFPDPGLPAKTLQYDLSGPTDLAAIQILGGNLNGADGRVFFSTRILYSTDDGANFDPLGGNVPGIGSNSAGYYQSDASGTINNATANQWQSTLLQVYNDAGGAIATGVTNLQIELYAADNTGGQFRDPFDGVNTFTGIDDGLSSPNSSPLIWEIDVIAVPEPSSIVLVGLAVASVGLVVRKRR